MTVCNVHGDLNRFLDYFGVDCESAIVPMDAVMRFLNAYYAQEAGRLSRRIKKARQKIAEAEAELKYFTTSSAGGIQSAARILRSRGYDVATPFAKLPGQEWPWTFVNQVD